MRKLSLKKEVALQLLRSSSFIFIAINILVAFLGFVRSFAFMKFFDFKELGIITLVSTAAALIGFFQIGLINGGYRIIALQDENLRTKTNNVVFSFFGILLIALVLGSIVGYFLGWFPNVLILIVVNVLGIGILVNNWLTNTLIGGSEFKRLNIANAISASASLLCLILAFYFGLYGALLSLVIQPILFIVLVFTTDNKELPTKFDFDLKHIKYILSFGFIPFISGIFFMLYQQIERWSVNLFLGPEALGQMYLVFLTTTLWILVPTSFLNLFFPKAIKFHTERDLFNFNKIIKLNIIISFLYCITISGIILVLLKPFVGFFFPKHLPYAFLVFLVLPGLIFRTLLDPISLYLNSIVRLKPIFWSDFLSTIIYVLCILFLFLNNSFTLSNFIICFNIYICFKFLYLLFDCLNFRKNKK